MSNKRSVLITGASGQLGSFALEKFSGLNYNVLACGSGANLKINLDITNPKQVNEVISTFQPDILINYAAISSPRESIKNPSLTFDVNYGGTLNILEAIRLHSRKTRAIFISSSEIFGKRVSSYETFDDVVVGYQDENTPFDPQTPYAASKAAAQSLVDSYRSTYNLSLFNIIQFGAESHKRTPGFFTKKVTHFVGALNSLVRTERGSIKFEEDCLVIGNSRLPKLKFDFALDNWKDISHASDAVDAHILLATSSSVPGNYVVGSGEAHRLEEFVGTAFKFAQFDNFRDFCIIPPATNKHFTFNDYICSKPAKINSLGWKTTVSFEALVFSLVSEELNNQGIAL